MLQRAVHPGQILKDELEELGVTPTEFARQIDVPPNRVSQIINGKRSITGDTALRFGHWFGLEPQFWLNLQVHFDLVAAEKATGDAIPPSANQGSAAASERRTSGCGIGTQRLHQSPAFRSGRRPAGCSSCRPTTLLTAVSCDTPNSSCRALVVKWISHRSPEPGVRVRFPARVYPSCFFCSHLFSDKS